MTEKREIPKHDLKLDRLSEREKVNPETIHMIAICFLLFVLKSPHLQNYDRFMRLMTLQLDLYC